MTQDQIIIDIDESELEVVQTEFGEIEDEFDELALMDRRQAVIETLQEEVELEDLSLADADRVSAAATIEDDEDDDSDEDEDDDSDAIGEQTGEQAGEQTSGQTGDQTGDQVGEQASDDSADGDRKRKRRRRRKKPAAVVMPELTAPPHKDFWEVWAAKFTHTDFEDGTFVPPNQVPEVEDEPPLPPTPIAPRVPRERSGAAMQARPAAISVPSPLQGSDADDREFVKVCLNLGRTHGHKAATIRSFLRDHLRLEGRAVRDLTVRDADTLLRVHNAAVPAIQAALAALPGLGDHDHRLAITLADSDDTADLRAPLPSEVAAEAATATVATPDLDVLDESAASLSPDV